MHPRTLDNGIDRASLLAEAAVDAFGHIQVVSRSPSSAVCSCLGLDGDSLSGADCLAQLAGDTALLSRSVSS